MPKNADHTSKSAGFTSCERISAILDILQSVNSLSLDLDQTLTIIVEKIKSTLGYPLASIFLLNDTHEKVVLRAFSGNDVTQRSQGEFSFDLHSRSAISNSLTRNKAILSKKYILDSNDPRTALAQGMQVSAAFPLSNAEGTFGILEILAENSNIFSENEMEILKHLAVHISIILNNSMHFATIQQILERYRSIQQISTGQGQEHDTGVIIHQTIQTLSNLLPKSRITFLTLESNGNLRIRSYAGYSDVESTTLRLVPGGGAAGLAARELKPQRFGNISENMEMQCLSADTRSILAVPVQYGGNLLGILNIESAQTHSFSEDDFEIVSNLADNLAANLSNQTFVEQIRQQMEHQKQLYDIANKIRHSNNIETIMRITAEEICNVLNLHKATIKVNLTSLSANGTPEFSLPKEPPL